MWRRSKAKGLGCLPRLQLGSVVADWTTLTACLPQIYPRARLAGATSYGMLDTHYLGASSNRAQVRIVLLLAVLVIGLLSGMLAARLTHTRDSSPAAPLRVANASTGLSETTRQTLQAIRETVDVHFYSLLNLPEVPDHIKAFSGRVDELLRVYESESQGRLRIVRHSSPGDAAEAVRIGLRPVIAADQDAAYLGIVVARENHCEVLAQLLPEWEAALEADLTRALQRLRAITQPAPALDLPPDSELLTEAKKLVPNLETTSLEEGRQLLKSAAVAELKVVAQEGQARIKEAQDRVLQAQVNGSETEQQEALDYLRKVQTEHSERLQELAERSDARLSALERAKQP